MSETHYIVDILILLTAAVVAVPLFQRLGLGAVLGFGAHSSKLHALLVVSWAERNRLAPVDSVERSVSGPQQVRVQG